MTPADLPLIHRFVAPARPGLPTLLLLHGTGGDENDLIGLGHALLPGAGLLSPRGNVLEGGTTPRFFRRLAEGVFDIEDLIARTKELAEFVRGAAETYHFDPKRVIAAGYSNGANIAASLLLLEPATLAGAVLFRAMVPLVPEKQPDLAGVPVLLMEGRFDPLATPAQAEALAELLRSSGAKVTLAWQEAGHGLAGQAEVNQAHAWLEDAVAAGS